MEDPKLAGKFFRGKSWDRWKIFLAAVFALPPRDEFWVNFFRARTKRENWPTQQAQEVWAVTGVRGGKSRTAAFIAFYLAAFRDYSAYLSPGETGVLMVIAADRKQARVVFQYIAALFSENALLSSLVASETKESITLKNRVRIEVHTANYRSIRGYTVVGVVLDEIAFWPTEGAASPDSEILTAVRPRMATVPNAMMIAISSPYARKGELWEVYDRYFGKEDDPGVFVWQSSTRVMNPTVGQEIVQREYRKDPHKARAEYGGEFRTDVEAYITRELVKECTAPGRTFLPALASTTYKAFMDPSGGREDFMTLAIGHNGPNGIPILDFVSRKRPPFSPAQVVAEFTAILRSYRINKVMGDRYGGEWPSEQFKKLGITYEVSPKPKADLYLDFLPFLTSRNIELLDIPAIVEEFTSLERRPSRTGREIVDHPPHGHDDVANAIAGLGYLLRTVKTMRCTW